MVNDVCVVQVWSNVCLVHLVKNWARSESGEKFQQPKAFVSLLDFFLNVQTKVEALVEDNAQMFGM